MSARTLKTLVLALGVLVLIWVGVTFIPRGGGERGVDSETIARVLDGVDGQSAREIRIQGSPLDTPLLLSSSSDGWKVNGFAPDSGTLARFWEALEGAEAQELVATNPANHPRLGVVQDSAITLQMEMLSESRTLLMGKAGNSYGTAYVRLPEEDAVYLLEGGLRSLLTRSLSDWRNKRVASVDTSQVRSLELVTEGQEVTLMRSDSVWVFAGGDEADSGTVRPILGELARLDATGFVEPGDTLSESGASVTALGTVGDTLAHLEIGSGDGDRWMKARGDSIVYRVPSWRLERLLPTFQEGESGG